MKNVEIAPETLPKKSYSQNTVFPIGPVSGRVPRKGHGELSPTPIDFSHPKTPGGEKTGSPNHFFDT